MSLRGGVTLILVLWLAGCGSDSGGEGVARTGGTGGVLGSGGVGGQAPTPSMERPADYIRNTGFHTLTIELDRQGSLAPREDATRAMLEALSGIVDKPGGVFVVEDETDLPAADDGIWTLSELRELARAHVGIEESDGEISLHTMWLGGEYEKPSVLGVAWGNRHLAMFGDRINSVCSGLLVGVLTCSLAEATVWTHEVGHVIGLVDAGTPMVDDHEDPDHPGHDVSRDSVMYWAYDGTDFSELLGAITGSSVVPWGEECERDVAAVREGN